MAKQQSSGEGLYIACGLLIIVVCVAGSIATRRSVFDFFFIILFIALNLLILTMVLIAVASLFVYIFKRDQGDKRTLAEIMRQEYTHNKIVDNYRLFLHYLGEYLAETETYSLLMRRLGKVEKPIADLARKLSRPFRRDRNAAVLAETQKSPPPPKPEGDMPSV